MSMNPYESPRIPADDGPPEDDTAVAWPATGAYRYYETLVWHHSSPLPQICVSSGQPADGAIAITLRPLIGDDGSIASKQKPRSRGYQIVLPVKSSACDQGTWRRVGMLALGSGLILGALAAVWNGGFLMIAVLGIASITLLACGLRWVVGPVRIQLLCVDRTYFQLFGLHPDFLAALPQWPVPDADSAGRWID
jgi:hypothetical protein